MWSLSVSEHCPSSRGNVRGGPLPRTFPLGDSYSHIQSCYNAKTKDLTFKAKDDNTGVYLNIKSYRHNKYDLFTRYEWFIVINLPLLRSNILLVDLVCVSIEI